MSKKSLAAGAFKEQVCSGKRCTLWAPRSGCDGPLDCAHWVPAQRLRAHTSTLSEEEQLRCVYDPRAARPMCRRHHHLVDNGFRAQFYEDIPQETIEWAEEWGILWSLERDYPSLEELRGVV